MIKLFKEGEERQAEVAAKIEKMKQENQQEVAALLEGKTKEEQQKIIGKTLYFPKTQEEVAKLKEAKKLAKIQVVEKMKEFKKLLYNENRINRKKTYKE